MQRLQSHLFKSAATAQLLDIISELTSCDSLGGRWISCEWCLVGDSSSTALPSPRIVSLLWDRSQWYLCLYPSVSGHSLSTVALQLISPSPTLLILVHFLIKTHLSPLDFSFMSLPYTSTQHLLTNVMSSVLFWDIRSKIPSVQKQPWHAIRMSQVGRLRAMSDLAVCLCSALIRAELTVIQSHTYTPELLTTVTVRHCEYVIDRCSVASLAALWQAV